MRSHVEIWKMTDIRKTEKTPVNMANNFERVKNTFTVQNMQVAMKCWRTAKSHMETTLQNVSPLLNTKCTKDGHFKKMSSKTMNGLQKWVKTAAYYGARTVT